MCTHRLKNYWRRALAISFAILLLAGCACPRSGTPLDTSLGRLNPGCWFK